MQDLYIGFHALPSAHSLILNSPAWVNIWSNALSSRFGSIVRQAIRAMIRRSLPGIILPDNLVTLDRILRLQRLRSTAPPTLLLAITAYLLNSRVLALTTNTKYRFENDLPSLRIALISCELRSVAKPKLPGIPAAFSSISTSVRVLRGYSMSSSAPGDHVSVGVSAPVVHRLLTFFF